MEEINTKLNYLKETKELIRQAIIDQGVEVPERTLFSKYPELIKEISTVPTLSSLKKALDKGNAEKKYPVGTQIPDNYSGSDRPWTVMDYGEATLSNGTKNKGVYLVRLVSDMSEVGAYPYEQLVIHRKLNNEYLTNCTDDFRNLVTEIQVPYFNGQQLNNVKAKCWLLSVTEIMGKNLAGKDEGYAFELWKQRTGLTVPSNDANNGRILKNASGGAVRWWTRSYGWSNQIGYVLSNGGIDKSNKDATRNIIVACFIRSGS